MHFTTSVRKRARKNRCTMSVVVSKKRTNKNEADSKKRAGITLEAAADLWLLETKDSHKMSTSNKYIYLLSTHILPALGKTDISQLSGERINDFLKEKSRSGRLDQTGGLSASYVRSIMQTVRSILKFAEENGLRQPMTGATYRPAIESPAVDVLSLEEQRCLEEYLLNPCNPSKLGIFIALQTGLRIGEVCALSWNDIDLQKGLIHVRHTVVRTMKTPEKSGGTLCLDVPKTRTSLRTIPISARLQSVLDMEQRKQVSDYVASNREGLVSPRTFDYRYHRILEQSKLPMRNFHTLRHTFATRCIEAGVDIKTLSEILGHSNTAITLNTYVHSSIELKRSQLERMTTYIC